MNSAEPGVRSATGPTSPEGKAISSRNSEKHHVFDSAGVRYYESQQEYDHLLREHLRTLRPQTAEELTQVRTVVSATWLMRRLDRLEPKLIDSFAQEHGIDADDAFITLFTQPRNSPLLHLYRRRNTAQNQWDRAMKELRRLQKARDGKPQPEPIEIPCLEFVPTTPSTTDAEAPVSLDTGR